MPDCGNVYCGNVGMYIYWIVPSRSSKSDQPASDLYLEELIEIDSNRSANIFIDRHRDQ